MLTVEIGGDRSGKDPVKINLPEKRRHKNRKKSTHEQPAAVHGFRSDKNETQQEEQPAYNDAVQNIRLVKIQPPLRSCFRKHPPERKELKVKPVRDDPDQHHPSHLLPKRAAKRPEVVDLPPAADHKDETRYKKKGRRNQAVDEAQNIEPRRFLGPGNNHCIENMGFNHHQQSPTAQEINEDESGLFQAKANNDS